MKVIHAARVALAMLSASGSALAQDAAGEAIEPENVLVRGTIVSGVDASDAVYRAGLDSEQITALNAPDVATVLRSLPGIDAASQGGGGGLVYVSIRGGDPNFTVVLIDGVQVDDPTNSRGGGFDFSGLNPAMLERVEVFYGSFSAVFGSAALGGVISITTKGAAPAETVSASVEVGTDGVWGAVAQLSGQSDNGYYGGISASARDTGDAVEGDSMEQEQVAVHFGKTADSALGLSWKLNLFGSDSDATSFPTASGGDRLAVIRDTESRDFEQRTAGGYLAWSPLPVWRMELRGGYSHYEELNDSPAIVPGELTGVPPTVTDSEYERTNVSLWNTFYPSDGLTLGLGAELAEEDGRIDSVIDFGFPLPATFDEKRDTWAVFGEASYTGEFYTLLGSVRHDDVEDVSTTNSRLAASFDIQPADATLWLNYSEGFKMPSLFALGHSLTGNPDLEPESSESLSGTFEKYLGASGSSLSFTVFKNRFKDLVDFDAATFRHVNRARAETKGVELGLQSALTAEFEIRAYVGYLDSEVSDGTKLEHRPEWKFGADATWRPTDRLMLVLNDGYGNDGSYSLSVPTGETSVDGYVRFDLGVHWRLSEHFEIRGQVDNLFDEDYEEVVGFSPRGRQARLTVTATL